MERQLLPEAGAQRTLEAVGCTPWLAGAGLGRLEYPDILAPVHLCLVEACHLGVSLDDRFELSMAGDLIEVCKPVGCPLLDHVDDTLWTARAVVLDDLGRHSQARGFIRLERHHDLRRCCRTALGAILPTVMIAPS